jgi:hypothetical protein
MQVARLGHYLQQLLTRQHMQGSQALYSAAYKPAGMHHHCSNCMFATAVQVGRASSRSGSHRRPQQPQLDGPFPLEPGQASLRCQHISSLLLLRDSGQAPGAYDGPASKDATSSLARAPTPKVRALQATSQCVCGGRCRKRLLLWVLLCKKGSWLVLHILSHRLWLPIDSQAALKHCCNSCLLHCARLCVVYCFCCCSLAQAAALTVLRYQWTSRASA